MKKRYLETEIAELALKRDKMAFISGPRQCGKTTFAKTFIKNDLNAYYNWDDIQFRKIWSTDPKKIIDKNAAIVLDDIHKARNWKRTLKGLFDTLRSKCSILVTGSARLNVYKKGGDSLMGRYLNFRFHPFSLGELAGPYVNHEPEWIMKVNSRNAQIRTIFERLFAFSGFPEPYVASDKQIHHIWQRGRHEKIVREDIRDLTQIRDLGHIEVLMSLLPSKVASPLSLKSLQADLEISFETVKRWLAILKELYFLFDVLPYSKSVTRSIKKEAKIYLWDWTEVEDLGARFENIIASHLLKACHYWTDTGRGTFDLCYLKNKEKQEIDFLIVKNNKPWIAIEAKLSDTTLSSSFLKFFPHLSVESFFQVVMSVTKTRQVEINGIKGEILSADEFLARLP